MLEDSHEISHTYISVPFKFSQFIDALLCHPYQKVIEAMSKAVAPARRVMPSLAPQVFFVQDSESLTVWVDAGPQHPTVYGKVVVVT